MRGADTRVATADSDTPHSRRRRETETHRAQSHTGPWTGPHNFHSTLSSCRSHALALGSRRASTRPTHIRDRNPPRAVCSFVPCVTRAHKPRRSHNGASFRCAERHGRQRSGNVQLRAQIGAAPLERWALVVSVVPRAALAAAAAPRRGPVERRRLLEPRVLEKVLCTRAQIGRLVEAQRKKVGKRGGEGLGQAGSTHTRARAPAHTHVKRKRTCDQDMEMLALNDRRVSAR